MHGIEWLVDARGCSGEALRDVTQLQSLFASVIADLRLRPVGETLWHQFPGSGGVTGLCLLAESHLTCHTFPEHESICVNLFCCVPRPSWPFESELRKRFGASDVSIRELTRSYETIREKAASD